MNPSNKIFLPVVFSFLLLSCATDDEKSPQPDPDVALKIPDYSLISKAGDTIRSGVPIRAEFKIPDPDSIVPPISVPMRHTPKVFPARSEQYHEIEPRVTVLPQELPTTAPGVGGYAPLTTQPINGKVLPFRFMPPTEAKTFRFNDDANVNIKYLDVDQGMGSSYVSAILEDSRSNFWIGTSGAGMLRFDGKNLTSFNYQELGIFNMIPKLEDSWGNIWFVSYTHGAICYDGERFIQFGEVQGLLENSSSSIIEDDLGRIWVGSDKGANCLELNEDGVTGKVTYYTSDEGLGIGRILRMMKGSNGDIWFVGVGGFCRYNGHQFKTITPGEGLPGKMGYSILEDKRGRIWLGTETGLSRLHGDTLSHFIGEEGVVGPNITGLHEDEKGRIWLSFSGGVSVYDGKGFQVYTVKNSGIRMQLTSVQEDSYGNFWFGSQGRGLIHLDVKNNFETVQEIGTDGNVSATSIIRDKFGGFWFGTLRSGVYWFDGKQFLQFSQSEGLINNYIRSISEDHAGHIWIGTWDGLSRFTPDTGDSGGVFLNFTKSTGLNSNSINDLMEDENRHLWVATSSGLNRMTGEIFVDCTASSELPEMFVSSIFKSSTGAIWLSTSRGVVKMELEEGGMAAFFTFFTTKEGLGLRMVNDIAEDGNRGLWFAGRNGVYYYDGRTFSEVPLKDGWWNHSYRTMGSYNSLFADSLNRIWISREKELSLVVPRKQVQKEISVTDSTAFTDHFQVFDFGKDNGIFTFEMYARSILLDDQNRLWWGGGPYCVRLDLDDFQLPEDPPKVDLNHIEIRQQFVDFRALSDSAYRDTVANQHALMASFDSVVPFRNYPTALDLPYHLNHLTFHFAGIDWADPTAIRYRFKIEGLDENWSQPQASTRADYRNLPPGQHRLMVQAIGKAQKWSESFIYPFRIRPPWWQTGWAFTLWILLAGGLVYAIYRYQLKRRLALAENERLLEMDQVKSRLFTNITHEFRTPLTIILGMIDQIRSSPEKWLHEGSEMIRRNGRQVLHLVNQMLDLARIESATLDKMMVQTDVVGYLKYLAESFQSLAITRQIQLHFTPEMETYQMDFDPDHLMQVVTNLLSNALKFTPAAGEVHFTVAEEKRSQERYLKIRIGDTGPGIALENLNRIFDRFYQTDTSGERKHGGTGIGLALTKELVDMHGGSILVDSQMGRGTEFTVLLPVSNTAPPVELLESEVVDRNSLTLVTSELEIVPQPKVEATGTVKRDAPELLIVEDNVDVIRYLQTCLREHYKLIIAKDGIEGIDLAINQVPDIIISDVMMPGKSGFELCQTLKNNENTSHIPIILLTARGDLESKVFGLSRGADVYLPKPFYQKELLAHLNNLIEQRRKLQEYYQSVLQESKAEVLKIEDPFLSALIALIEENLDNADLGVHDFSAKLFMSRVQLFRKVKALTGKSPSQFIRSYRLGKARAFVLTTGMPIAEIAYRSGFSDPAYFSRMFKLEFGLSPTEMRGS